MPAKTRPPMDDPFADSTEQIAEIMGTNNPAGVRDGEVTKQIAVDVILPNPHQPRKEFDEDNLAGLAVSIQNHGLLEPLVVTYRNGKVFCIAGERRLRAAKKAGLRTVPCLVRKDVDDAAMEDLAFEENAHRENLSSLEEAYAIQAYMQRNNVSGREAARRRGLNHKTVQNRLDLLRYPPITQAVADGRVAATTAAQMVHFLEKEENAALREEILAVLAAGQSLTLEQELAATGRRLTPPPAKAVEPVAVEAALPLPPITTPPPPNTQSHIQPTEAASTEQAAPPLRSPAPDAPMARTSPPATEARPETNHSPTGSQRGGAQESDERVKNLQALQSWLAAQDWSKATEAAELHACLAALQEIEQQSTRAIQAIQEKLADTPS